MNSYTATSKCVSCGSQVTPGANFCGYCGSNQKDSKPVASNRRVTWKEAKDELLGGFRLPTWAEFFGEPAKKSSVPINAATGCSCLMMIIAGIMALIGILILWFAFLGFSGGH